MVINIFNSNRSQRRVCKSDREHSVFFFTDECTTTRIAVFLNRFFYKIWFFGACYYWGTWVFLLMFVVGFFVSVVKKRRSVVDEEFDSSGSDTDDDHVI